MRGGCSLQWTHAQAGEDLNAQAGFDDTDTRMARRRGRRGGDVAVCGPDDRLRDGRSAATTILRATGRPTCSCGRRGPARTGRRASTRWASYSLSSRTASPMRGS